MENRKVLLVDYNRHVSFFLDRELKKTLNSNIKITVLAAVTIKDAERLFSENPYPAVIFIDSCIDNGEQPDSIHLIKKIKRTYAGPMVAIANKPDHKKLLMEAGCNRVCDKNVLHEVVLGIFGYKCPKADA